MDPLSLTASLIAVIGVGGNVAKSLKKVLAFRDAPKELLALNKEIIDFRLVLDRISDSQR